FCPHVESLEDRRLLSTLSYATLATDGTNNLVLQIEGNQLAIRDNGTLGAHKLLSQVDNVVITGADGEVDTLTIDYTNGFFLVPVLFTGGAGGGDAILLSANVDFSLSNTSLITSQGSPVPLAGVEQAVLTGGAGNNRLDASAFTGSTTLDGGAGDDILIG